MTRKPQPPNRPAVQDQPGGGHEGIASPRNGVLDPSWRADALGRSRHSRLADEVRAPMDDTDPVRAELVCARITRTALRDYAPALLLLSANRRRRVQALTAWTVTLFDFALRPGLAGLDGDRLAQINAWEFRTEEALDGNPPGQPVFVMMAREEAANPWPREALDRIVAAARRAALRGGDLEVGSALLEALLAAAETGGAKILAPLLDVAIARETAGKLKNEMYATWTESVRTVAVDQAPAGWKRASSYGKRTLLRFLTRSPERADAMLGLAKRLELLARSVVRPR